MPLWQPGQSFYLHLFYIPMASQTKHSKELDLFLRFKVIVINIHVPDFFQGCEVLIGPLLQPLVIPSLIHVFNHSYTQPLGHSSTHSLYKRSSALTVCRCSSWHRSTGVATWLGQRLTRPVLSLVPLPACYSHSLWAVQPSPPPGVVVPPPALLTPSL